MLIAYDSMTGNVKRFIHKLNMPAVQINENLVLDEEYVLITYTTGFGNVPERVLQFLERNHERLKGVAASGNRNWGDMFGASADKIATRYEVPVVSKFELSGTNKDVEFFKERVLEIATH
ncbi:class Ib ribonucleoside-diphosphate reductase assembly flavoprotein NrdI [Bacillus sp. WLY-B-L8]|uniref:class Ib ribonucleoside-diphosphate reductase assembly flavoprotein NrdI n=1 Tax=Bacillus multifaciens TaxID=3068506 RepID=UPI002741D215|nr:class Ib ribonucleoside-diphosphate reductase assembly flavoprotein NrdI [Bacillus sp. WLY-B-L8]MDP7979367.1 class Ib ribonucleoside-diphosphate reductase assembly flavoprotein NrdI [Bacillus sp. WLY-B-L8]HDX9588099.1 class Ib ribonucleoside-diphosphate reductase assembly flavoprotein NrdI [Bacillus pseudomycoides]